MDGKPKRPRLQPVKAGAVIEDVDAFIKNKSSDNARKVFTQVEQIEFDIWFDKHYYSREQHGDDDGKREGIEIELIKKLIEKSASHLIFYSLKVRPFAFINFEIVFRPTRILLTQVFDDELELNVIAEYHFLNLNRYEVTIKTAMRKNAFKFSDGQYKIQIEVDNSSTLFKNERGQTKTICSFAL